MPVELRSGLDDAARRALEAWANSQDAKFLFERWLDNGRTAAKVAVVVIDRVDAAPRKVILKRCPASDETAREPDCHQRALDAGPVEFVAEHLVDLPFPAHPVEDGGFLMFQGLAGGSLESAAPLAALENNDALPVAAATVVRALLVDWNPQPTATRMTAHQCVLEQLGARGPGGALDRWDGWLGQAVHEPWLTFSDGGPAKPNPVWWTRGTPDERDKLIVLTGRAHGDLHLDNLIAPMGRGVDAAAFSAIDLSAFSDSAPLCRDPAHLVLATIGRHLHALAATERQDLLDRIVDAATGKSASRSLRNLGLEELAHAVLGAGDGWAGGDMSMGDDWRRQLVLGVTAGALVQSTIAAYPERSRWWFLELAATTLGRHIRAADIPPPTDTPPVLVGPDAATPANARTVASALLDATSEFNGRKTVIAVVGEGGLRDPELLSGQPWDLVVEFDPATDEGGAFSQRRREGHDHRLVTHTQETSFAKNTTVWLAANGLDGVASVPEDPRAWRIACLPAVQALLDQLARSSSRPACLCVLGDTGLKARAVVEAALDVYESRLELLVIAEGDVAGLAEYGTKIERLDPSDALAALPDRGERPSNRAPTIPGRDGPVELPEQRLAWFEEVGELVHSEIGHAMERESPLDEAFYRGAQIDWLELSLGADIAHELTTPLAAQIREDLARAGVQRILLDHHPGAGGTTLARRLAWELRTEFPTLVVERIDEARALVDRILGLHDLTDNPVFVVVEATPDPVVERAYSSLRSSSTPTVLLIVRRGAAEDDAPSGPTTGSARSFHLGPIDSAERRKEFADLFAAGVPSRAAELQRLARRNVPVVPFLFGLTAYESNYVGLDGHVERSLERASDRERDALARIALVHRYAGVPTPAEMLASALEAPAYEPVDVEGALGEETLTLLVEERAGEWRTAHQLIAQEVLRQALAPSDADTAGEDAWRIGLRGLAGALIDETAEEFGATLPRDARYVLARLFIAREKRTLIASDREQFSELLSDIPGNDSRVETLHQLAKTFPEEPHYWAHYGRLLSYEMGDYPRALEAVNRAIDLRDDDDALHHMRGMVLRAEAREIERNREQLDDRELERRYREVVDEARGAFEVATELNDISEYGHVALIQLCVEAIELGKRLSGAASYAEFLAQPTARYYRDLLGEAEEAIEAIDEIRAGDSASLASARVEARLNDVYDDFSKLLQGWRNLLDRNDVDKGPVRRHLVHAYRKRAGGTWSAMGRDDRDRAVRLLEENLADDPRDTRSLIAWLRLSRLRPTALDQAAERISLAIHDRAVVQRELRFYDYVVSALLALEGRQSAVADYERKVHRSKTTAETFARRREIHEWYANGSGLGRLAHRSDLLEWDRTPKGPDPERLSRIEGRLALVRSPQAGEVAFGPTLRAFCKPGPAGLVDADVNTKVSFLLGFSYDGPIAWGLMRLPSDGAPKSSGIHTL